MKVCPTHRLVMTQTSTPWGARWHCPFPRCTVACWNGRSSTPADLETRLLRRQCHARFDPLWKSGANSPLLGTPGGKKARRARGYSWLAATVGVQIDKAHFGMFTADQCRAALAAMDTLCGSEVHA